ncbi:MAG: mechanosensitive ion channel [Parasporobacterium sp.]|nr:mechanosensitive ion channel [Parasporobacterium sp.]
MAKTANLYARIEPDVKEQAESILAALGIMGLVAGLGAQKLIGDLIAGVFIIFEGTIRVGDIVLVNDSYGIVMEIGMRTIQIVNKSGEIIAINNSMINKLTNLSKYSSSVWVTYTVPASVEIEKVEAVLRSEFAVIEKEKRLPDAMWGPIYMGINKITDKGLDLAVLVGCDEDRVGSTRRKLNREIKMIFEKHSIPFAVFYVEDGFRE